MLPLRVLALIAPLLVYPPFSGFSRRVFSLSRAAPAASWPYGPFTTEDRWIKNSLGETVTLVGANWPGAADTMAPEGLQYSSIADIVTKIKSLGMNVIRLTYAIQMIDEYYENGEVDIPFITSFTNALGEENGTAVFNEIIANNPQFDETTTRMQLFDAVAAECFAQEIYVHLDNHMSEAYWCCDTDDGNAWFDDTYFNVPNWLRGLAYMAGRGATWGNMMTQSLRNELREPDDGYGDVLATYNWEDWYANIVPATEAINNANPDVLIFLSGLGFDTTMAPITAGTDLGNGTIFDKADFAYADKLVVEIHNYQNDATNCSDVEAGLYANGYNGMNSSDPGVKNVFPVVMTEWGGGQDAADYASVYSTCLSSYLGGLNGGWMVWVLAGGYYIRQGTQDYDETWGLLTHDWSAWRDEDDVNGFLVPMIDATLAV